ncbi:MAG TPA: LacI family DNA-binding transcriptional regulator [Chitinophagaceae bacterium]|nr:LacI family DNA-binding transcriptional regulator [Chitinophagaceae bacterium]
MKKGVTIKDMAQKLNMSFSTISKALHDDPSIGQFTTERVKKLALEWDYIPNEAARNFKQSKSFTIGLIIPSLLDQFYVLAINGVEKVALEEKYNVIISQSYEDPELEKKIINMMISNRVDGLIVTVTKNTKDTSPFLKLKSLGIPVVYVARILKDPACVSVSTNNKVGAIKATEFLLGKGHKRIAHIKGPDNMGASESRHAGYKEALRKNGIPYDKELVMQSDLTRDSTEIIMQKFTSMDNAPTAILAFKNYISLEAIAFLKKNHPELLDKIDFVGFGNLPLLEYLDHMPIASVDENSYQIGIEAIKLLLKNILQPDAELLKPIHLQVPGKLVIHK